jgi:uncharacterized protein involved in exopolysaccharide biosynthesis
MKLFPTVIFILAGLLIGTAVWSDTKTPSAQVSADKMDPQVQSLKKQLSLTEQQARKLNEIFKDTNAQREALYAERAAIRNHLFDLHKKNLERINGVLTSDQAKKYEQIRSEPPLEVMDAQPTEQPSP